MSRFKECTVVTSAHKCKNRATVIISSKQPDHEKCTDYMCEKHYEGFLKSFAIISGASFRIHVLKNKKGIL